MKVHIVIQDDKGKIHEGTIILIPKGKHEGAGGKPIHLDKPASSPASIPQLDFTLQARAFVKKYSLKKMSGAQKFVLLLAWMTKGTTVKIIDIKEINSLWNKMTEIMGVKYNSAYSTRAKDNGLVELEKAGKYKLRPNWKDIFGKK